jgi:hypothetical protein
MKFLDGDLRADRDHDDSDEDEAADGVAKIHRHRNRVAAGFA